LYTDGKERRRAAREVLAKNLQNLMIEKGFTQAELARRLQKLLPDERIERDSISNYCRATAMPSPIRLAGLAELFKVEPKDLLPEDSVPYAFKPEKKTPAREMKDLGDGNVWLTINQAVPYSLAIKILAMLE